MIRYSTIKSSSQIIRAFSQSINTDAKHYKVLIVGGGSGGVTVANRISNKLGQGKVALVEPSSEHYYQPLFTLVGAGIFNIKDSKRETHYYIPRSCTWLQNSAKEFRPSESSVILDSGEKIKGAEEALSSDPRVCSNYSHEYCQKTFKAFQSFPIGGTAIFSHPNTPIKCGGAPQKIMYLFDDYLRKHNKRSGSKIEFVISLPGMFTVPKYSDSLIDVSNSREIVRHHRHHVIEINHRQSEVLIQNLDDNSTKVLKYDLLHITPPMCAPDVISNNKELTTPESNGYVAVDPKTMRSNRFSNLFSIGDCSSIPTSKTAAAVASQSTILSNNLLSLIKDKSSKLETYNGYTSCPLITGYNKGIIAEFGYENKIIETLPFDQSRERYIHGFIKKFVLPNIYWNAMLPGSWPGPKYIRKILHLDFKN